MAKNHTFKDTRIQTKRDTSANWELNNPILLNGEEILVDTNAGEVRKKVGDGTKKYTELAFTDEPLRALIANKVDKVTGKDLSTNDYTTTEKEKLASVEDGANKYIHPSHTAYSSGLYKVTVNNLGHVTAATAVTKADITGLGIPAQDTTYTVATTSANGLISAADKTKLDGIEEGANKYTHPTYTARTANMYKITIDGTGHVSAATAITKADITGLGIPAQDTTYIAGTGIKLDGTTINHSNSITAGTAQGDATKTLTFGGTFTIPTITYDAQGHITGKGTTTMTMPTTVATTSAAGLMSASDKTTLNTLNTNVADLLTRVAAIETKLQTAVFFG